MYNDELKWYLMDTVTNEPFNIIDFAHYVYGDDMTDEQLAMILTDELFKDVKISMLVNNPDGKLMTNDEADQLIDEED